MLSRAYATRGTTLYHDAGLRADLLDGLRWFVAARYHPGATPYGNWWDWHIGVPLALVTSLACLRGEMPAATLKSATDAIESFTPVVSATGANGAWRAEIILRRAILVEDRAKVKAVQDWVENTLLSYFEPPADLAAGEGFQEGFYRDGSFFAHHRHPYNGGYGLSALASTVNLVTLLDDTPWAVAGSRRDHLYAWIEHSFEPFTYRGRLFDNVRGREISRGSVTTPGPSPGCALLESLLPAAEAAPAARRPSLRRFVKAMAVHVDTDGLPAPAVARLQALLDDRAVPSTAPPALFRHYPLMARTVMRREKFGASVGMHSDSVYNYESLNHEHLQGWHTGDGWLQILDADAAQFSDGYWPTVDWHRLPGTTVVPGAGKPANQLNGSGWAGGAGSGADGVAGLELRPRAGGEGPDGAALTARKSWFMFGDAIFCVGSDIAAAGPVETVIENRLLTGGGDHPFTVDGESLPPVAGRRDVTARWLHLAGNRPGSGLGCVFPEPTRVQTLHETRTGSWRTINANCDDTAIRRAFLTLWLDHGPGPVGAAYAYILLPGTEAQEVARYANRPGLALLASSRAVHAVRCHSTNVVAANFWDDAPASFPLDGTRTLAVDRKACVCCREEKGGIKFAVSDPTRANRAAINCLSG